MNKIRDKFVRFMYGRYGLDQLNQFLLGFLLVCAVLNLFARENYLHILLNSWEAVLVIAVYYRMFSKNIQKRYGENQKYLVLENKVKQFFGRAKYMQQQRKEYHIYTCPQCKQKIRIPRGKGRIRVRCPKCGVEFVKNS